MKRLRNVMPVESAASVAQVTCHTDSQFWAFCDNRRRLSNGAVCFTIVKTVGRIYLLQLVVAALLLVSPEHLPGCDLFVLNLIVGKRNLVHIKPLSPSGPTNRFSFPSLVSKSLHGATGSSGSLC